MATRKPTTASNDESTTREESTTRLAQSREELAHRQDERAEERGKAGDQASDLSDKAADSGQHGDSDKDFDPKLLASGDSSSTVRGSDPMDPRANAREGWFSDEDPRTLAGYDPLKDAAPGANTGKNHKPGTGQDMGKEVAGLIYESETLGSDAGVRARHAARDGRFTLDDATKSGNHRDRDRTDRDRDRTDRDRDNKTDRRSRDQH